MSIFSTKLLSWYQINHRTLPWRETTDPYFIWLSEVILQQTRVDQGLPYYIKFIEQYPTIFQLAAADDQQVYKLWQGLGYYSRAKNMLKAARKVVQVYKGVFPTDLKSLKELPGIGPYTAAAIASSAFNLNHAVVDGNVYRVLSRVFGVATPINSSKAYGEFLQLAESLMPEQTPGLFNQAIMELGAMVCKPRQPNCLHCPLQEMCFALAHKQIDQFPVKLAKVKQQTVYLNYLIISFQSKGSSYIVLHQRPDSGIWANLVDFPCIESTQPISVDETIIKGVEKGWFTNEAMVINNISNEYKHLLTHRIFLARFISVVISHPLSDALKKTLLLVEQSSLPDYPVPVLVERYLRDVKLI